MTHPQPDFSVRVEVTNPGQVVACCGLLELAHRTWPGVEGWFELSRFTVAGPGMPQEDPLGHLLGALRDCSISGLSEEDRKERDALERQKQELKKTGAQLPADKEERRRELGNQTRAGAIRIGEPFGMTVHWWQAADEEATPKTWAGLQEVHKIARAAQDALAQVSDVTTLLDYGCVLQMPREYGEAKANGQKSVEPFYFDARRFAHRLDVGFSLDALGLEAIAHPAVELLCLIGLQRFRPAATPEQKWSFDYWTWPRPLSAPVAAAVFGGAVPIPGRHRYRFQLRFRDDQKRYKAFGFAVGVMGD